MKNKLNILALSFLTCLVLFATNASAQNSTSNPSDKIKVLNFATFHMGETADANKVDFDETSKTNQKNAQKIALMIAKFKPTIICVEVPAEEQEALNLEFEKYRSAGKPSAYKGEIGLIAFEVAKSCNIKKLYGIDYELAYNYNIFKEIENKIDPNTIQTFYTNPFKYFPSLQVDESKLTFFERMKIGNSPAFLDFLILTNADLLTHVGSDTGYEGADEAAKFYKRNLRIYANLNRIPATKADRIFIISGGSHTAFLREFMSRSPKYEMVNTMDYLK